MTFKSRCLSLAFLTLAAALTSAAASEIETIYVVPFTHNNVHTLQYAKRMNLVEMTPTDDAKVCSTRYCLQNQGLEYLVYQPQDEAIVLQLPAATWQVEWFDPRQGTIIPQGQSELEAGKHRFRAPFKGAAVLYLKAKRCGLIRISGSGVAGFARPRASSGAVKRQELIRSREVLPVALRSQ